MPPRLALCLTPLHTSRVDQPSPPSLGQCRWGGDTCHWFPQGTRSLEFARAVPAHSAVAGWGGSLPAGLQGARLEDAFQVSMDAHLPSQRCAWWDSSARLLRDLPLRGSPRSRRSAADAEEAAGRLTGHRLPAKVPAQESRMQWGHPSPDRGRRGHHTVALPPRGLGRWT